MGNFNGAYDESSGSPNLQVLQYLQENWGMTEIRSAVRVEKISVTASGTAGVTSTDIPVGAEIIDAIVHPTSSSGGGTATLSVGGGGADITDAITCATEDTIGRASSIDQTYKIVTSSGVTVTTNGDSDTCDFYVHYKK